MEFTSFENLEQYLKEDAKRSTINPVRFINVETIDIWVRVKSILNRLADSHIKISKFCEDDDTAPNLTRLRSIIKKVTSSMLITPISEYLRINNTIAKKTFDDFLHLEYENPNGKLRVYVPVYRMKEILSDITIDPRTADSMLFLATPRENDYSLTIIQKELKVEIDGNTINGFKKYMEYWEENPDKPIILHTQNAVHYQDIVFSDDVRVIISSYDLLRCHYNMTADYKKEFGTEEEWQYLAQEYGKTKNLNSTMCALLSTYKFSIDLFNQWKTMSEKNKWLLWLWAKNHVQSGYLFEVLKHASNYIDFAQNAYTTIIDLIDDINWEQFYKERLSLLSLIDELPQQSFWTKLESLSAEQQLRCLTNRTQREREKIILSVQVVGKLKTEKVIGVCYPQLSNYLLPLDVNESINAYFDEYRWAKVMNQAPNEFLESVNQIAKEKGAKIFQFISRHAIVNQLYNEKTIVLFVDALGVEYLPLLESIFKTKCLVGYCNMPSTTEKNKDFIDGKIHKSIYELDSWKHSNCLYPQNIIREIEIIEGLKDEVEKLLINHDHVILASDHGTSRLAVLYRNNNVLGAKEGATKYKYGRYCYDTTNTYDEYDGCINRDNYWIFGNYDRFSEHGSPIDEIHGGASLEEMLVPILHISRNNAATIDAKVEITLLSDEIKMSTNYTAVVQFKLSMEIASIEVLVGKERYVCTCNNGLYSFVQNVGSKSEYTAKIIAKTIIGEIKYKIKKGISSNIDF